jgi:hypothetical protein
MNKKEIIENIMMELDVTKEEAEHIFRQARKNGDIEVVINWVVVGNYIVGCLFVIMLTYAIMANLS